MTYRPPLLLSGYFLTLAVLVTSGCATWALASSSRSISWSTAYAGNNFLPHNPPLLPPSVRRLMHSLRKAQVRLNCLMALVIAGPSKSSSSSSGVPSGCQSGGRGAGCKQEFWQLGTSLQFAVLEKLSCAVPDEHSVHLHCMHLFKRHKYLLFIDQFIVDIYTESTYLKKNIF